MSDTKFFQQEPGKPVFLLPMFSGAGIGTKAIKEIAQTPRKRVPLHVRFIADLCEEGSRVFVHDKNIVALDHETMDALFAAGATLMDEPFRHTLYGDFPALDREVETVYRGEAFELPPHGQEGSIPLSADDFGDLKSAGEFLFEEPSHEYPSH